MYEHTHNEACLLCPTNGGSVIKDQWVGTIQLLFQSDPKWAGKCYVFVIGLANVNLTQLDQNDLPRILP